jgi:hypothetical protein
MSSRFKIDLKVILFEGINQRKDKAKRPHKLVPIKI